VGGKKRSGQPGRGNYTKRNGERKAKPNGKALEGFGMVRNCAQNLGIRERGIARLQNTPEKGSPKGANPPGKHMLSFFEEKKTKATERGRDKKRKFKGSTNNWVEKTS